MAIVTIGFGNIYKLVTLGFSSGNAPVVDVLQGGHFGFDEARNKKELATERQRRDRLKAEFAKLSEPAKEKVEQALAVNGRIEWEPLAIDLSRYYAALASIDRALREMQEDEEECLVCFA